MKRKILALVLCISAVFVFAGCGSGSAVATVNGTKITEADHTGYYNYLVAYYQQMYSQFGMEFSVDDSMEITMKTQAIDALVSMEEIRQACKEKDCTPGKKDIRDFKYEQLGVNNKKAYKQSLEQIMDYYGFSEDFAEKMLSQGAYVESLKNCLIEENDIKLSDEEAEKIYNESPESYDNRTVSHILIKPVVKDGEEPSVDENGQTVYTDEQWKAAEDKAKELIKELDDGADFKKLAKKNSDDTTASDGGALEGSFTKADSSYVEEFTNASFELKAEGEYTKEPVKSQYGYHIILCTGIQDKNNDFDEIIKSIKDAKVDDQATELLESFLEEYHEKADVEILYDGYTPLDEGSSR